MSIKSMVSEHHLIGDLKPGTFIKNVGNTPGWGVIISHRTTYKFQVGTTIIFKYNNSYNYKLMETFSNIDVAVTGYNPYNLAVQFVRSLKLIDRLQWKN